MALLSNAKGDWRSKLPVQMVPLPRRITVEYGFGWILGEWPDILFPLGLPSKLVNLCALFICTYLPSLSTFPSTDHIYSYLLVSSYFFISRTVYLLPFFA